MCAYAQISISEIYYDAPGTDTKQEWVEIRNTGSEPIELTKWKIHDGAGHVLNIPPKNGGTGSMVLAPNDFMILAADASSFRAAHPGAASSVIDTTLTLNNDSESISLLNASGTMVVSVGYSSAEGAAGDGNSLQRKGSGWIAALPTPGSVNATEPAKRIAKKSEAPAAVVRAPSVSEQKPSTRAAVTKKVPPRTGAVTDESGLENSEPTQKRALASTSLAQTASPASGGGWWAWVALVGIVVVASAGLIASRYVAQTEWEIEDVSHT